MKYIFPLVVIAALVLAFISQHWFVIGLSILLLIIYLTTVVVGWFLKLLGFKDYEGYSARDNYRSGRYDGGGFDGGSFGGDGD